MDKQHKKDFKTKLFIKRAQEKKLAKVFEILFNPYLNAKRPNPDSGYQFLWVFDTCALKLAQTYLSDNYRDESFEFHLDSHVDIKSLECRFLNILKIEHDYYAMVTITVQFNLKCIEEQLLKEDLKITDEDIQDEIREYDKSIKFWNDLDSKGIF